MENNIKQSILDKTNNGWDVFVRFFGEQCQNHTFRNIYRGDTRRSCTLYLRRGRYCLTDFGDRDWSGDCFHIVAKIQQLNLQTQFVDVLKIIDKELSLDLFSDVFSYESRRREGVDTVDHGSKHKVLSFDAVYKDFSSREISYWNRYGIGLDVLDTFHVRSISSCRFIRDDSSSFVIYGSVQFPMYGYLFSVGDKKGIKTYRPGADVRFLRAGTFPSPYVFGDNFLPDTGDFLFITGGEKDVMSLYAHGFHAICYNSETAQIPASHLLPLVGRFDKVVILYDMDQAGRKAAQQQYDALTDSYPSLCGKLFIGALPLSGSKTMKDVSDFFLSGHTAEELSSQLTLLTQV